MKKLYTIANEIEIFTQGLDNITIENSESNSVEVFLFDENPNNHHIVIEEKKEILNIGFKIKYIKEKETVFRKFITKRLHRAFAIIKVPKNKSITFFGENIDIESKSYDGNISIYIEKGDLKLHTIQKNILIKLYAGTITAKLKKTNIDVVSNIGKIVIDDTILKKRYQLKDNDFNFNFRLNSVKANVFLTSIKTK